MKTPPQVRRSAGMLCAVLLAPLAHGQTALFAQSGKTFRLVREVILHRPYVQDDRGKLVAADGPGFGLRTVPEYAPVYVSVSHLRVGSQALELENSGTDINREFDFHAEFESPYRLEHVFVVLDMNTARVGKVLFLQGIGELGPREPRTVDIVVPMSTNIGRGRYQLHIYSDGAEVFQSQMPFEYIEGKLDEMVRRRIKGVQNASPRPFVGPSPEYPAKLLRAKVSGEAVIDFTINENGMVVDPAIARATDPAFGESALAAARMWRFLPRVRDGRPVATKVAMPFLFKLPPAKAAHR